MEMMEQYSTNLTSSIAKIVKKAVKDATRNLAIETSTHQPESQATNATTTGGVLLGVCKLEGGENIVVLLYPRTLNFLP